jgi:hypothetical protein
MGVTTSALTTEAEEIHDKFQADRGPEREY